MSERTKSDEKADLVKEMNRHIERLIELAGMGINVDEDLSKARQLRNSVADDLIAYLKR